MSSTDSELPKRHGHHASGLARPGSDVTDRVRRAVVIGILSGIFATVLFRCFVLPSSRPVGRLPAALSDGPSSTSVDSLFPAPAMSSTAGTTPSAVDVTALLARIASLEARLHDSETDRERMRGALASATPCPATGPDTQLGSPLTASAACEVSGLVPDRHAPWGPSEERARRNPELARILSEVAPGGEVLACVSNGNLAYEGGMLGMWIQNVRQSGVTNFLVIALDQKAKEFAERKGARAWLREVAITDSQKDTGTNHAVSALKFTILQDFLELGYSVLLSDVDIVTLRDPFGPGLLARDADVEGMTDGFDAMTAYGWDDVMDDPKMGWSRYAHTMRIFVMNSGLFYIRPTLASMDLLRAVEEWLAREAAWDQAVFNHVLFLPSRPGKVSPHAHARILDYEVFMNSKYLFTVLRHDGAAMARANPAMIHVNYHPDKQLRMQAIVRYWRGGDTHALDGFPDGSE